MKNSALVCLSLSRASDSLVMIGVSEFLPIYIENQFMLTRSDATTLAGTFLFIVLVLKFLCKVFLYIFMKYFK